MTAGSALEPRYFLLAGNQVVNPNSRLLGEDLRGDIVRAVQDEFHLPIFAEDRQERRLPVPGLKRTVGLLHVVSLRRNLRSFPDSMTLLMALRSTVVPFAVGSSGLSGKATMMSTPSRRSRAVPVAARNDSVAATITRARSTTT